MNRVLALLMGIRELSGKSIISVVEINIILGLHVSSVLSVPDERRGFGPHYIQGLDDSHFLVTC